MRAFQDQHGVALPLALIALVALTAFVAVFLGLGSTETQVGQNHSQLTGARYVAETGIEWAYDQLIQRTAQDPNASFRAVVNNILGPPNNGVMANGMPLPGLPATSGTFSVTLRNDSQANDNQITGQPVDPDPTTDTNDVVILTATGTFNAGACAPVWGIGVADATTESRVQSSLSQQQKDNVTGKPQSGGPGLGDNTIAPDLSLTPAQIAKFVNTVKPYADMSLQASGSNRLQYTNIGDTCGANLGDPNCWGTRSNPKIVYVKGSLDPGQTFYALSLSGTSTGAGILIIEDGDLSVTGNFRWEGIILITGQYVGLRYGGGGNQTIYGGVVVNETANVNTEVEVDAAGNPKVLYSCQALNNVRNMRQLFRLASWREL